MMVHMPLKPACGFPYFLLKDDFLGLTTVSSGTTAFSNSYLYLGSTLCYSSCEMFFFFKSQNVTTTVYYGIENPLPDKNFKILLFLEGGGGGGGGVEGDAILSAAY